MTLFALCCLVRWENTVQNVCYSSARYPNKNVATVVLLLLQQQQHALEEEEHVCHPRTAYAYHNSIHLKFHGQASLPIEKCITSANCITNTQLVTTTQSQASNEYMYTSTVYEVYYTGS